MTESKQNKGHTFWQWFSAVSANLTLLSYGMQAAWLSPSMKLLQSESSPTGYPLSTSEISWLGGILGLAAAFAVLPYGYMADRFGRKFSIFAVSAMQGLGWVIKLSTANTTAIMIARIFCGFAGGGCYVVIPMYVKEIAQDNIRGTLGSLLVVFMNIGILFMYLIGAYCDYYTVLWIATSVPVITMLILIKSPESPAYLMKMEKSKELAYTLALLRGLNKNDVKIQKEMEYMKKEDMLYKSLPDVSILSIFTEKTWSRVFFLIFGVITFHALNGVYSVITYASAILSTSSNFYDADLQSLSFPCIMILTTTISMGCVEKFGRKPVLAISLGLISASMFCVGTVVLLQTLGRPVAAWISLLALLVCVSSYTFGLSHVPFIIMSESFNFQIRARAVGTLVTYSWFLSFIQLLIFNPLSSVLGLHGTFFLFGAFNLIGFIYVIILIPETKGKSVEQIETILFARKQHFIK